MELLGHTLLRAYLVKRQSAAFPFPFPSQVANSYVPTQASPSRRPIHPLPPPSPSPAQTPPLPPSPFSPPSLASPKIISRNRAGKLLELGRLISCASGTAWRMKYCGAPPDALDKSQDETFHPSPKPPKPLNPNPPYHVSLSRVLEMS